MLLCRFTELKGKIILKMSDSETSSSDGESTSNAPPLRNDSERTKKNSNAASPSSKAALSTSLGQSKATPWLWKIWMIVIFIVCVIMLVFAIWDVSAQFRKPVRSRSLSLDENYNVEDLNDDDPSNDVEYDTETRYSASYIFAGPLNLPSYFFLGVVLAYLASRSYNLRLYYANVKVKDMTAVFLSSAVALLAIFWRLAYELKVRSTLDKINHIERLLDPQYSEIPDTETVAEYDIPYVIFWGASPYSERSQYLFMSMIFIIAFVLFIAASFFFLWLQGDSVFPPEKVDPFMGKLNRSETVALSVSAINLFLSAASLSLYVFVVLAIQVSGTKYWLIFNNTPFLVFSFIFAGWCTYLVFAGEWWIKTIRFTDLLLRTSLSPSKLDKTRESMIKRRKIELNAEKVKISKSDLDNEIKQSELRNIDNEIANVSFTDDEVEKEAKKSAKRARLFSILTFVVTFLVGGTAVVFNTFHLMRLTEDCSDDPLDSSSDLKQGVCQAIYRERKETNNVTHEKNTGTINTIYFILSIWLFVSVILQFIISIVVTILVSCTAKEYRIKRLGSSIFSTSEGSTTRPVSLSRRLAEIPFTDSSHLSKSSITNRFRRRMQSKAK